MYYKISDEYTDKPGGRYISDGKFSGEDFREKKLKKMVEEYRKNKEKITIDFDGGYGYGNSFLEESFGGLVRKGYSSEEVLSCFNFISNEEPSLVSKVEGYIKEAIYEEKM